jgi:hypothetical protein
MDPSDAIESLMPGVRARCTIAASEDRQLNSGKGKVMRKNLSFSVLSVILVATALYAHHGPTTITIDAAAAKQPGVSFDHHKHSTSLADSCDTCHHTQQGLTAESDANVQKCSTCHLDPKGDVPSMRAAGLKDNPFHVACISCHREQKKGPTTCKQCHA